VSGTERLVVLVGVAAIALVNWWFFVAERRVERPAAPSRDTSDRP
jgi:hypothetical protein